MYSTSLQHFKKPSTAGFGLIELMVSISIMMLVAAIILVRQDAFNGSVLLRSQAYEVALAAREVQLNAVSASTIQGSTRDVLGLYFNTGTPSVYKLFRDADQDSYYDASEEYGQQGSLDSRFVIKSITAGGSARSDVAVVFERPNFDAKFFGSTGQINVSSVEIVIGTTETGGPTKTIVISSSGQVTVQ